MIEKPSGGLSPHGPFPMGHIFLYAGLIGFIAGLFTVFFLAVFSFGEKYISAAMHERVWYVGVSIALVAALLVGVLRRYVGMQEVSPEEEFSQHGKISYRHFFKNLILALVSLFSGASIGPEGGLGHLSGQISTKVSEWLRTNEVLMQILIIAGVASAFSAFLGSPLVGTFLVMEMYRYKKYDYDAWILPSLLAGSIAFSVYWILLNQPSVTIFSFPDYTVPILRDAFIAIPLSLLGLLAAIVFGLINRGTGKIARPLRNPIGRAFAGGCAIAVAVVFLPIVLFSGHHELTELLSEGLTFSLWMLLLILLAKMLLTAICFKTGFKGGPIFPFIFMGTTAGLLLHALIPVVTPPLAVMAVTTGFLVGMLRFPLSVIVLLTLMSGLVFMPIIIFSAVTSYVVLILRFPADDRTLHQELIPS